MRAGGQKQNATLRSIPILPHRRIDSHCHASSSPPFKFAAVASALPAEAPPWTAQPRSRPLFSIWTELFSIQVCASLGHLQSFSDLCWCRLRNGSERATDGILNEFLATYGKSVDPAKEEKRLGKMHKEAAAAIVQDYGLPMTGEEYSRAIMPLYQERWSLAASRLNSMHYFHVSSLRIHFSVAFCSGISFPQRFFRIYFKVNPLH